MISRMEITIEMKNGHKVKQQQQLRRQQREREREREHANLWRDKKIERENCGSLHHFIFEEKEKEEEVEVEVFIPLLF
jgi:hypothetical protein